MAKEINIKMSNVVGMDIRHNGIIVGKIIKYENGIMTAFIDDEYKDIFKLQKNVSMEVLKVEKVR